MELSRETSFHLNLQHTLKRVETFFLIDIPVHVQGQHYCMLSALMHRKLLL
jgi:hypothetical protein